MIDEELKAILVCPACKGDLLFEETYSTWRELEAKYDISIDVYRGVSLEQQAAEEATFVAVLLAFGEGRVPVVLGVTSGNPVRGLVAAVGRDFCAVRTVERGTVLVRLEDITDARVRPGHSAVIGTQGGGAPTDMALADVLFGMAGERPEVVISLRRGGGQLSGELRTVGVDVASLRTRSDPPATIYVPMDAVSQVSFRP